MRDYTTDWAEIEGELATWSVYDRSLSEHLTYDPPTWPPMTEAEDQKRTRESRVVIHLWLAGAPMPIIGEAYLITRVMPYHGDLKTVPWHWLTAEEEAFHRAPPENR